MHIRVVHSTCNILTGGICSADKVFADFTNYSGCIAPPSVTSSECFLLFLRLFCLLGGPFPLFYLVVEDQMGGYGCVHTSVLTQMCINYSLLAAGDEVNSKGVNVQGVTDPLPPVSCLV